ncbi:iron-containing alcohol dehydrogenase [Albidovulum aquaemixtae]|uniref:iron-containing alcohol dehydrogenase n=1 Tax=Albidovulum aquaemixtae TaxID=1542388 RepID=UPI000D562E29|nr:iron-containing alcohol dehydrogenase [Defluviimonas aquaemixtae]
MSPFAIAQPKRIRFGRGESNAAVPEVAAMGTRVFLVHGRDPSRADWLRLALKQAGLAVTCNACPGEPTLPMLETAVAAAKGSDLVVALGGGAAIDLGKAVAALVPAPSDARDHLEVVGRGRPLAAEPLPFVAIPTTAGTGAEVTKNAVFGVPEHRRKVSLRDDRMIADLAVVDPALTDDCPGLVTLGSGLDAITQVIEPFLCTRANAYTDALCRAAIPTGLGALRRLMSDEDPGDRDAMAWVSLSGGLALANSGLGAVHGLAGVIGGTTGAPHGAICGALLPHVLRANAAAILPGTSQAERFDDVFRWIGEVFGEADGVGALEAWMHEAGLPRLSAQGLDRADYAVMADAARASSSMSGNPAPLDTNDLSAILRAAG